MSKKTRQPRRAKYIGKSGRGVPCYEMPDDCSPAEVSAWVQCVSIGASDVALPCILEVQSGDSLGQSLLLRDKEDCRLVMEVILLLSDASDAQADRKYQRWLRRAWDAFQALEPIVKALRKIDLPTQEETDEWWLDAVDESNRLTSGASALNAEKMRRSLKGRPKRASERQGEDA